jgi:hypothetical protein
MPVMNMGIDGILQEKPDSFQDMPSYHFVQRTKSPSGFIFGAREHRA